MADQRLDAFLRHAVTVASRRASLAMLGAAAAAIAAPWTIPVQAGKKAKKRARKKCKRQVEACRATWRDRCATDIECEADNLERILACCSPLSTCKAGAALDCLFAEIS